MSDLIRVYGMEVSHKGVCRKCQRPRDEGSHDKCDRWPGANSMQRGFRYVGNSKETTLAVLKRIVDAVCSGDSDDTPIQFDLRVRSREEKA